MTATDSDAERWRFLADHKLTLHTAGGEYMVHLVQRGNPPDFLPVSFGPTADDAIDAAIRRYETRARSAQSSAEGLKT